VRRWRAWPRSLAARTALVLVLGLGVVQIGGLLLHSYDRLELLHAAQEHELARRAMEVYRDVALARPERRQAAVEEANRAGDVTVALHMNAPDASLPALPSEAQRHIRSDMLMQPVPPALRPRGIMLQGRRGGPMMVGLEFPDGMWLKVELRWRSAWPWQSPVFLGAFTAMSAAALLLTLWAVQRLTRPVATLAEAAERLGRDVHAPPLPETGPMEVATAAAAFNAMAARIRRFVDDRTFLITALGHDLRTPITRLRLRAEFMEDDDQRQRMLADLAELESMVTTTLAFGQDATLAEPMAQVDLAALVDTVLNEAIEARGVERDGAEDDDDAAAQGLAGPDSLVVEARPISLKRALTNLVGNALAYGGAARATLWPPADGMVTLHIDDDGPGIPPAELERVFLPFHRLEASRNRATGGMGLGLSIARDILRAHGGDVVLTNRREGGLRATVTLPL
jgi:signal transduction histidine kinase